MNIVKMIQVERIGNSRRIKENSFKFINEIEKNLGNLTLENIMKQLEEKGIHFSEEEMNKVTQILGRTTNLTQEKAQEIQKPIEQNKDDEGR